MAGPSGRHDRGAPVGGRRDRRRRPLARRRRGADKTGSIAAADPAAAGPFAGREDRVSPALALAYAEQPDRGDAAPAVTATPIAAIPITRGAAARAVPAQTGANDTTIAVKRAGGRQASVVLSVASKAALDRNAPLNDPWLRAVVMSPSVHRFLTITALGAGDYRSLAALMHKPDSSVMMTFAADPRARSRARPLQRRQRHRVRLDRELSAADGAAAVALSCPCSGKGAILRSGW